MTKWATAGGLLVATIIVSGCESAPAPKVAAKANVAGTVLLDGKPMAEEQGEIAFLAPGEAPVNIPVKDGKFEGQGPVGESRVEIRAWRTGEPVMMDGKPVGGPTKENYVPSRFNAESKMKASVQAGGAKDLKFEVESK